MIQFKDISFGYDDKRPVFKNLSFEISPHTITGIIGPNGAGKSTLLQLISNTLMPYEGQRFLFQQPLTFYSSSDFSKKVAWVQPDSTPPLFHFLVRDILMMGRYPYQGRLGHASFTDHALVLEVAAALDLTHFLDRFSDGLSSGEWQRVLLCRAFIQQPELLLLDEPFTHLDLKHILAVGQYLQKRVKEKTVSVVVVSHDLGVMRDLCDRLLLFGSSGQLCSSGTPDQILTPQSIQAAFGISEFPIRF